MDKPTTPEPSRDKSPGTYKGVPVPETLRPNWNDQRVEVYWWKCGVDAATELDMVTRYDNEFSGRLTTYGDDFAARLDDELASPCPCGSGKSSLLCSCVVDTWPVEGTNG
jgi:hypothetical protein